MRKEIVATTEGGAITGEERLREHVDEIYGAINSVEDRPTDYQMARIDALDRELKEVEAQWAALRGGRRRRVQRQAQGREPAAADHRRGRASIPTIWPAAAALAALVRGLVGTRFYGNAGDLKQAGEKD